MGIGICGAVLIVVGLVASGILSPLLDRVSPSRRYLPTIKILVPVIAISYLGMQYFSNMNECTDTYLIQYLHSHPKHDIYQLPTP